MSNAIDILTDRVSPAKSLESFRLAAVPGNVRKNGSSLVGGEI